MTTKRSYKGTWIAVSLLVLAAVILVSSYVYKSVGGSLPVVRKAPDFTLEHIDGSPFQFKETQGSVRLVEFMFTYCPDICPQTTFNMSQIQKKLQDKGVFGNKVKFISITFDPVRDTPERLTEYAKTYNMDMNGWILLRGSEESTQKVAKDFGVLVAKLADGQFTHNITSLMLVDETGNIRKIYKMGEEMDNDAIVKDISSLISQ